MPAARLVIREPRGDEASLREMKRVSVMLIALGTALGASGCSPAAPDGGYGHATIGGVIEVAYETGPVTWRTDTERACKPKPTSQPDSLAPGHVWYAEPRDGESELLACLKGRPHVLSVALPR